MTAAAPSHGTRAPVLRPAVAGEAGALSELALRSKAHWGYDAEFLEAVRAELTIPESDIASGVVWVAELDGSIAGFHVVRGTGPEAELDAVFVDEPFIGRGVGGALLRHALDVARSRGILRLDLDADPGAESFYTRFGARRIGESPSGSIPGRVLPRMRFDLAE